MTDPVSVWRSAYRHPGVWERAFPPLTMPEMFAEAAARRGEAPLIDFMGQKLDDNATRGQKQ